MGGWGMGSKAAAVALVKLLLLPGISRAVPHIRRHNELRLISYGVKGRTYGN